MFLALVLAITVAAPNVAAAQESSEQPAEGTVVQAPTTQEIGQEWTVVVDGEVRSWKPLERGTDIAWAAYLRGDYKNAVPVFDRLANLGHPVAQWLMGHLYYNGQGVPLDYGRSYQHFLSAANQGFFKAYASVASMLEKGQGIPADPGLAYSWYNVAVAALPVSEERNELIRLRDKVALVLTPAQVEAAQKRANGFRPKPVVPPDIEDVDDQAAAQ